MKQYFSSNKLLLIIVLIPILFTTYLVCANGANMPYMDDWSLVHVFQNLDNGTFSVKDLWEQHNEHRIFLPNLVTVLLAQVTHWNLFVQMILNLVLSVGILWLIYSYIRKTAKSKWGVFVTTATSSILLFSPVQWENWLWGWQIEWYMCILLGVSALYLLDSSCTWLTSRWRYVLAALCCVGATYSLGSGMFFWFACAVPLVLNKHSWRRLVIWAGLFGATLSLYLYKYKFLINPERDSPPVEYVRFLFGYIGQALSHEIMAATALGMLLLGLMAVLIYNANRVQKIKLHKFAFPIGLVIFVGTSALVTLQSRLAIFGSDGALASRYSAISCLVVIAVLLVLAQMRTTPLTWQVVAIILIPLMITSYYYGTDILRSHGRYFAEIETCIKSPNPTNDCLGKAYPDPNATRMMVDFLKKEHLGGF